MFSCLTGSKVTDSALLYCLMAATVFLMMV